MNPQVRHRATGFEAVHETGGSVTLVPLEQAPAKSTTAGRPMPQCEVRVVDSSGHTVPPGQHGQIVVRRPQRDAGVLAQPPGD